MEQTKYGIYISHSVGGIKLDKYMQDDLDLKHQRDYIYITNIKISDKLTGILILNSYKGAGRWVSSLGMKGFSKPTTDEMNEIKVKVFGKDG